MLYYSFFAQSVFEIVLIVRLLRIDLRRPYSIRLKCPDIRPEYFGALRNQLDNVSPPASFLLVSDSHLKRLVLQYATLQHSNLLLAGNNLAHSTTLKLSDARPAAT